MGKSIIIPFLDTICPKIVIELSQNLHLKNLVYNFSSLNFEVEFLNFKHASHNFLEYIKISSMNILMKESNNGYFEGIQEWLKYHIHQLYKCCCGIFHQNKDNQKLIMTIIRIESNILYIYSPDNKHTIE